MHSFSELIELGKAKLSNTFRRKSKDASPEGPGLRMTVPTMAMINTAFAEKNEAYCADAIVKRLDDSIPSSERQELCDITCKLTEKKWRDIAIAEISSKAYLLSLAQIQDLIDKEPPENVCLVLKEACATFYPTAAPSGQTVEFTPSPGGAQPQIGRSQDDDASLTPRPGLVSLPLGMDAHEDNGMTLPTLDTIRTACREKQEEDCAKSIVQMFNRLVPPSPSECDELIKITCDLEQEWRGLAIDAISQKAELLNLEQIKKLIQHGPSAGKILWRLEDAQEALKQEQDKEQIASLQGAMQQSTLATTFDSGTAEPGTMHREGFSPGSTGDQSLARNSRG